MFEFLYQSSNFCVFLFTITVTTAFSLLCIILCKAYIFHKLRYRDNQTIGSISSLIGIIYGVLIGFIALYLIDNNDHAAEAVLHEANAVANIYRVSTWLKDPIQHDIQTQLKKYVERVIKVEWPLMRRGRNIDNDSLFIISRITDEVKNYPAVTNVNQVVLGELLQQVAALYNARQERIAMSSSGLTPEIWEVILVGTILIIGINYAFRVNFYLHLFAILVFSIMAASMLFLLITLDRPFQGEFAVETDALNSVLIFMNEDPAHAAKLLTK